MSHAPKSQESTTPNASSTESLVSFPQVYDCLREIAAQWLAKERSDHTLQPTALVHEAYLRLAHRPSPTSMDRKQFSAMAATAMRRVLVDHARRTGAKKRRLPADTWLDNDTSPLAQMDSLLDLESGLEKLHAEFPRACRVVELRFFAGMTVPEAADVLGVSSRTVDLDWRFARAWLLRSLSTETVR